jgi:hypothetical protein
MDQMADLGTDPDDCIYDGSVIQSYVGPESPLGSAVPLTWGAFQRFDTSGNAGIITVQKWAMHQGSYLPYGYQEGRPKTWKFLRLGKYANLCSGAASFACEEVTGSKGFIIGITPNGEFKPGHNFWFFDGQPFILERGLGALWQSVSKEADQDRYPTDYSPNSYTSGTYIEPESCACNCENSESVCPLPSPGQCPFEPTDNYPPFGP